MNRRDLLKLFSTVPALPAVKAVEQFHLEADDAVVLSFDEFLTPNTIDRINYIWKQQFPGVPLIVLEKGVTIQVLKGLKR